jgi:hypothetical protein
MKLIRKGALQATASMLLGQSPQISMGESDINEGIRLLEEARAKARATRLSKNEMLAAFEKLKGPKRGKRDRKE